MKAIRKIPAWGTILILLLLANLGWISWNVCQNAGLRAATKRFKIEVLHTNDISGTEIIEAKTGNPVWIEWNYTNGGKSFSYFWDGTNIFNLHWWKGRPLGYDVGFYGPGKSSVWWWDLGRGTFVWRNFFDTNGDLSKHEIWYDQTWRTLITQNGKNGIIINGQWHKLILHDHGLWTIEAPTNAP